MSTLTFSVPADPALSAEANTNARGDLSMVTFNSISPKFREWLPTLPYIDAADGASCSLPYAVLAFFIWPALYCSDPAVESALVLLCILGMDKASLVMDKLASLDFTPSGGAGSFISQLVSFLKPHKHDPAFTLVRADLVDITPFGARANRQFPASHSHAQELSFAMVMKDGSMQAMSRIEMLLAPRLVLSSRVDPKGQTLAILRTLNGHACESKFLKPLIVDSDNLTDFEQMMVLQEMGSIMATSTVPDSILATGLKVLDKLCFVRMRLLSHLIMFHSGSDESKNMVRQSCFKSYASPYCHVAIITDRAPSDDNAFHNISTIHRELYPAIATPDWSTAGMARMDTALTPYAAELKLAKHSTLDADELTQVLLNSIAQAPCFKPSSTASVAAGDPTSLSLGQSAARTPYDSKELHAFSKTKPVLDLLADIEPHYTAEPRQHRHAIIKIMRSRLVPVIQMLLATRPTIVAGFKNVISSREHLPEALAWALAAETDPASSTAKLDDCLQPFVGMFNGTSKSHTAMADALLKLHMGTASTNLFAVYNSKKPYESKKLDIQVNITPADEVMFGNYSANAKLMPLGDNLVHFHGFDSGAYSDFLAKPQAILAKWADTGDDEVDISEAIHEVVTTGHAEMAANLSAMLKATDPSYSFPMSGTALTAPNGAYAKQLARLETLIAAGDEREVFVRRKRHKDFLLDTASKPRLPSSLP